MSNISNIKINIHEELKSNIADNHITGDKIFALIKDSIEKDHHLIIDFKGIEFLNTAFLNNAIGKIYTLPKEKVEATHIKIENFPDNVVDLLEEIIITAKLQKAKKT